MAPTYGHPSRPCFCPPHPDVCAVLEHEHDVAAAAHASSDSPQAQSSTQPSTWAQLGNPTSTTFGLNDGIFIPPSEFPEGTSITEMRAAALEREPLHGSIRTIVVLVDFPDQKMAPGRAEYFKNLFFGPKGSVNEYYREVSGGAAWFTGDVVGPFTLPRKMTEYANGESGMADPPKVNSQTMAVDALKALQAKGHDLSTYDNNGNGLIDAFVVVHAGSGAEAERDATARGNKIWSVKWVVGNEKVMAGKVGLFAFLTIPEDAYLGVTVHEIGHLVFSWPDLYDGDSSSAGLGHWCLMAGGSWLGSPPGSKPCHPSAWCKAHQGWVQVVQEDKNRTITLADVKESRKVHRLWTNGAGGDEYFLLENRQKAKYDTELPSTGLFIWHVDEKQRTNRDESRYKVGLVQADGQNHLAKKDGRSDSGDPFPGHTRNRNFHTWSNPNSRSHDGNPTNVSVTNISDSGPSMTADITVRGPFYPVYQQGDPGNGIGGYDLRSASDLSFAYDYASKGALDQIVIYRPGRRAIFIVRRNPADGSYTSVYAQGDPGNGIGGYDLASPLDRGLAFDYNSSGKLDHLVFYRPSKGAIFIIRKNPDGTFSSVYTQGDPGSGIGGYDLKSTADRVFAFDYDRSGKQDHLALYRPGKGAFFIVRKNPNGTFSSVYAQGDPGSGIGGFDLKSPNDKAFAFDWTSSGKMDHIAFYRPGSGVFWVVGKGSDGKFAAVFTTGAGGIGGYDFASPSDVAFAFDWTHSGKNDHVAIYRPGTGTFWVVGRQGNGWRAVHSEGSPGNGVGGFDLKSVQDKMYAFDFKGSGRTDGLVAYRTNASGTIWILGHV
ncbi:immune inhibitor A peptidase M6-domain-containing protein [Podospora aff. communis PSN243]|uniref:Immune inhibitor A peptidase M6-domain-containing protein n=1 Tax=Podospora aff. communis PSN243 TaxID=3040156 RepID=A0AAV9GL65_9PEZI|nr:immune inhibitor A peptidase M6-domain-containing protein [Podospora aff. communis PSN243]